MNRCMFGDCRDSMRGLIAQGVKVQTCVTSPPYWGLRDYGVDGQLGLESSPAEYVAGMVEVFRLVRDLLSEDGTLWLNLGDSYTAHPNQRGLDDLVGMKQATNAGSRSAPSRSVPELPPKNLVGIPWRVAFALQADGWYLRQDIIWAKPNPMPESVTDRCTKSHEYLFLLAKSERYYYDQDAISERAVSADEAQWSGTESGLESSESHAGSGKSTRRFRNPVLAGWDTQGEGGHTKLIGRYPNSYKGSVPGRKDGPGQERRGELERTGGEIRRNRRSVWTVPTFPFPGAHFATFPPALIEPCILAGSRPGDIVFDPFFGSGTTGQVAQRLGRQWIGCELNHDYEPLQRERTAQQGMVLQ